MPGPARGIGGSDERPVEDGNETESGCQPPTERIDWAPCGCWMDPDEAERIDRQPSSCGG